MGLKFGTEKTVAKPEEIIKIEKEELKETTQDTKEKATWEDVVMALIIKENPRLTTKPQLLGMFVELIMFRLETKKDKVCQLKATINHINVGVNITKEIINEYGLDSNSL